MTKQEDDRSGARVLSEQEFVLALREAKPAMRALVLSMCRPGVELEDILQEAVQAMWKKRRGYDAERPFTAWALGFVRMQSLAYLKKKGREGEKLQAYAVDALQRALERQDALGEEQRLQHLRQCLAKLSVKQKDLLHRRYHLGYSITEIAAIYSGKSREALYKIFQRLHQSLMKCVQDRYLDQPDQLKG